MSTNRQINIYVNSGDAEKALGRITQSNAKLNDSVKKNQTELDKMTKKLDEFKGDKRSTEYKKLQNSIEAKSAAIQKDTERMRINSDEMSRIDKKIKGELSPSYNNLRESVYKLNKELRNMSTQDIGFDEKIKELRRANQAMTDFDSKIKKTEQVYGGMARSIKGVAIGSFIAEGASKAISWLQDEFIASINTAKELEGVSAAFKRLNNPNLLDQMRHAVKGTVSDLELMKMAVQSNNFQIPLEQLAGLFEFAKKRAQDTGQEVDFLVNSIVTGIGRKSPLILDNLGITASRLRANLGGVTAEAASIGQVATAVGKIIQEENAKSGKILDSNAVKIQKNKVEWENLRTELGTRILPIWTKMNEAFYGTAGVLAKIGKVFIDFFGIQESGIKKSVDTVFQQKEEAASAQRLLTRYEELKEKGIKATSNEKSEMTKITYDLKNALGDSVVAINKETGALEVNIEATKQAIKQKILLSNAELSKVALEYNNAKASKELSSSELDRINKARAAENDATLQNIANSKVRAAIANEDQSTFLKLKPLRDAALLHGKAMLESDEKMLETKKSLAKYGFKIEDFDFDKLAANAQKISNAAPDGTDDKKDKKIEAILKYEKELARKIAEIRLEQENAMKSDDEKALIAVSKKYDDIEREMMEHFGRDIERVKKHKLELDQLENTEYANLKQAQQYQISIRLAESAIEEEKKLNAENFANGLISEQQYNDQIYNLDRLLILSKINISDEYAWNVKQAENDLVNFKKSLTDLEIKDAERKAKEQLKIAAEAKKQKERLEDLNLDNESKAASRTLSIDDDRDVALKKIKLRYDRERELAIQLGKDLVEINKEETAAKEEVEQIHADKVKQIRENLVQQAITTAHSLINGFTQIAANNTDIELRRETKSNDEKKKKYKQMLDSKQISQKKYDELVLKADEESAKKQAAIKKKQFEAERNAKYLGIGIDTAAAIMKIQSTVPPPWNIPLIAMTAAQGLIQAAVVASTPTPEFRRGGIYQPGILDGPSHENGGLGLYNEQTGKKVAEYEGGEAHMLLSKQFTKNNADIIPHILDASRTGARLSDSILRPGIPSLSTSRVVDSIRFREGGILAKDMRTSVASPTYTPDSSTAAKQTISPDSENIRIIAEAITSILSLMPKEGIAFDYNEFAKKLAIWWEESKRQI